jgi:hypothetical protein
VKDHVLLLHAVKQVSARTARVNGDVFTAMRLTCEWYRGLSLITALGALDREPLIVRLSLQVGGRSQHLQIERAENQRDRHSLKFTCHIRFVHEVINL